MIIEVLIAKMDLIFDAFKGEEKKEDVIFFYN